MSGIFETSLLSFSESFYFLPDHNHRKDVALAVEAPSLPDNATQELEMFF